MNESKIKENIKTSYKELIDSFGEKINRRLFEAEIGYPIQQLFDCQKNTDKVFQKWGKSGFKQCVALYLSEFQTETGVDHRRLLKEIESNEKWLWRYLGRSNMNFLKLILALSESIRENPKGLLAS